MNELLIKGDQLQFLIGQLQDIPYKHSAPVLNFLQYLIDTSNAPAAPQDTAE